MTNVKNWWSEFTVLIQDLQALSTAGTPSASSQAVKKWENIIIKGAGKHYKILMKTSGKKDCVLNVF